MSAPGRVEREKPRDTVAFVRLTPEEMASLTRVARDEERSRSAVLRRALRMYVTRDRGTRAGAR